ncbi:MAG: DHH family phosphoesterase [Nanoarchaeota archaeon]|nr:DHH family phosphoesterase [Nanoarchaeota archaeon]
MKIPENVFNEIKKEADTSSYPLIFFDDDADGLSSFLMLYKYIGDGTGVIIKTTPIIDDKFIKKAKETDCDKIFILDIAEVKQEFIESVSTKIVWVDHHQPQAMHGITYFNPSNYIKNSRPASYMMYKSLKNSIWLAAAGCIGDWYIPDFIKEFAKEYPDLWDENIKEPDAALFSTKIGLLAKVFNFMLKGTTKDAMVCVKIMTRIKSPYEILDQTTAQGKFIWKKFMKINTIYERLISEASEADGKILTYIYQGHNMSLTSDLSNELLYRNPDKVIIVGRERNGELKLSFRAKDVNILKLAQNAMEGTTGFCGGHNQACGGMVKRADFESFLKKVQASL